MKVLFCIENYKQGGIPVALGSMLSQMSDNDGIKKDVFCLNQEDGPYKPMLDKYVVNQQNFWIWAFSTYYTSHKGLKRLGLIVIKTVRKCLQKFCGVDLLDMLLRRQAQWIRRQHYDVVVAYAEGIITHFVARIQQCHKIAWIHIDYKRHLNYANYVDESDIYAKYDSIVIPSKFSLKSFNDTFPSLSNRSVNIPNLVDVGYISKKASQTQGILECFTTTDRDFRIISIGRVCYEKRFYEIPHIAASLKERSLSFKWFIVGSGSDIETNTVKQQIAKYDVEDEVVLTGALDNPYPLLRLSDLLVVTSLSETFSYVIAEAKVLGTPIVSTDFGTVHEVMNEQIGVIVPIEKMAEAIGNVLEDDKRRLAYRSTLRQLNLNNKENIQKLEALFRQYEI